VPFRSDIPGRPETQVGRWHAMRKKGENDEESQGGEVGLTAEESLKDVDWETIWDRSLKGSEVPPALRGLRCVRFPLTLARPVVEPYMVPVLLFSSQKTRRAYCHHSHGQRPPGFQRVTFLLPTGDQGWSSLKPFHTR